jgi:hypothetical protein
MNAVKEAFDRIMKFLGINDLSDIPIVLEKMNDQEESIETLISNLTNDIHILNDKKRLLEFKIEQLNVIISYLSFKIIRIYKTRLPFRK